LSKKKGYYLKKYGLLKEDYYQLLHDQSYKCKICGCLHKETPDKKWKRARLSVDHDHETGEIRGLLCYQCNFGLGLFKDDPQLLLNSISYLSNSKSGFFVPKS
jgi:hypothetical protein